jgi:signal transduction histidine kinase
MVSVSGRIRLEVRFDDRLLTVLSQPAGDRHDAAVRWRQLVDLVARAGSAHASAVVARALDTIRAQAPSIDEDLRAAAARAVAGRPLPIGLLEYLVSERLSVAAPVLAAASLDPAQWRALLPLADEETRQFIEALHPEAVRPSVTPAEPPPSAAADAVRRDSPAEPPPRSAGPSLSDVVARIERRRRSRETQRSATAAPAPQQAPSLFRWECGPSGEIAWVDGAPRGALIGRSIARIQDGDPDRVDEEVVRAFARRAPFRDAEMRVGGDGLVAGAWRISGLPAFDATDGRFAGYRGIAQRDSAPPAEARGEGAADVLADPDSLRELVHEIKTPLNAIIGFAEIIQGQYIGPADQRYRERAGEIVAQAKLLVGAVDDLDFVAKAHSSGEGSRRVDLGGIVQGAGDWLAPMAAERGIELELAARGRDCIAALEPEVADRLIVRFASALFAFAEAGEHLRIWVEQNDARCQISISRPALLRNQPDSSLFEGVTSDPGATEAEGLSSSFVLRLVRGLARIAGGDLVSSRDTLTLVFPRA